MNDLLKGLAIWILLAMILFSSIYSIIIDDHTMESHHFFFEEMLEFKTEMIRQQEKTLKFQNEGERFTADEGRQLEARIQALEDKYGH